MIYGPCVDRIHGEASLTEIQSTTRVHVYSLNVRHGEQPPWGRAALWHKVHTKIPLWVAGVENC